MGLRDPLEQLDPSIHGQILSHDHPTAEVAAFQNLTNQTRATKTHSAMVLIQEIFKRRPGLEKEIFLRADKIIEHMIEEIVRTEPVPIPQVGTPELFKRRTPSQSNIDTCPAGDVDAWYDHIRMLDATGYPHAFLEANGMRLELRRVSKRSDGLYADVKIVPLSQGQTDHHNTIHGITSTTILLVLISPIAEMKQWL